MGNSNRKGPRESVNNIIDDYPLTARDDLQCVGFEFLDGAYVSQGVEHYVLKETFWSLRSEFTIFQPDGTTLLSAKGQVLSWRNPILLKNKEGLPLLSMYRKMAGKPRIFRIFSGEINAAKDNTLMQDFVASIMVTRRSFDKRDFYAFVRSARRYLMRGNYLGTQFVVFNQHDQPVAHVKRGYLQLSSKNTYQITVASNTDLLLVFFMVMAIDEDSRLGKETNPS